jgi:hypothetical protein
MNGGLIRADCTERIGAFPAETTRERSETESELGFRRISNTASLRSLAICRRKL